MADTRTKTRGREPMLAAHSGMCRLLRTVLCVAIVSIIAAMPAAGVTYFDAPAPGASQADDARDDGADVEIDPIAESLFLIARAKDDQMFRVYEIGTLHDPVEGHNIIAYQAKGVPLLPRANVVYPMPFVTARLRGPRIMTVNISHHGLLYIRRTDKETSDGIKSGGKRPVRIKPPGPLDVAFALGAVVTMIVLLRRRGIAKKRRQRRKVKVRTDVIIG